MTRKALHLLAWALVLANECLGGKEPQVQSCSTAVGSASSVTVAKPAGVVEGDLLVAGLMLEKGADVAVTPPAGWTLIRRTNRNNELGMATYYKIAGSAEPATCAFTLNNGGRWAIGLARIGGADTMSPISDHTGHSGNPRTALYAPSAQAAFHKSLALAYFTSLCDDGITAAGLVEQYDAPNTAGGLPGDMLATAVQATPGPTGKKEASAPRQAAWAAQQLVVAPADKSCFTARLAVAGPQVAGTPFDFMFADARSAAGAPLRGAVNVKVESLLEGAVFDGLAWFTQGTATVSIVLINVDRHVLAATVEGITEEASVPVIVNRRPVTIAASPGQGKVFGQADPELRFTLAEGNLIPGFPLVGALTREEGEAVGGYAILQGTVTEGANPFYAIAFRSAPFLITPIPTRLGLSSRTCWCREGSVRKIRINRLEGSVGRVSVRYATAPGSALPWQDYIPTNGTLVWNDGEVTPKIVRIRILGDAQAETTESFMMLLKNPQGGSLGEIGKMRIKIINGVQGGAGAAEPGPEATLAGALGGSLYWSTSTVFPWEVQPEVTLDGAAAASGGGGQSWLKTRVQGPGVLDFAWRLEGEGTRASCLVFVDGHAVRTWVSGGEWRDETLELEAGDHTVSWVFVGDEGKQARAFLDQVSWSPRRVY